jgi:hypothetical protein
MVYRFFFRSIFCHKFLNVLLPSSDFAVILESKMFYLVGLLHESRGNQNRAKQLFKLVVEEERTNRWPGVLARATKKIGIGWT